LGFALTACSLSALGFAANFARHDKRGEWGGLTKSVGGGRSERAWLKGKKENGKSSCTL
jgi:hypothetical protein